MYHTSPAPPFLIENVREVGYGQKERLKIPVDRIRKYFPKSYTAAQMEEDIVKMCEIRYKKRIRDKDSR